MTFIMGWHLHDRKKWRNHVIRRSGDGLWGSSKVLFLVQRFIACTPNLLVILFSGMDCLTIPMQMTHSCI